MPKRSNEFQRLIYLVKKYASPKATVTESKFLAELDSKRSREVDIAIEMTIAGHPIIISIECVDHKRTVGVPWVEQMYAKHQRLPTTLLVLASRGGFSKPALDKAASWNIQTLAFTEVTEKSIGSFFGSIEQLYASLITLQPIETLIEFVNTDAALREESVDLTRVIVDSSGRPLTTVKKVTDDLLEYRDASQLIARRATPGTNYYMVVGSYEGQGLYLPRLEDGRLLEIKKISAKGKVEEAGAYFPIAPVGVGDQNVLWGTSKFMGDEAMVVVSDPLGSPHIALHIGPYEGSKKKVED